MAQSKALDRPSVWSDDSPSADEESCRQIWLTIRTLDQRLAASLNLAPNWPGADAHSVALPLGNNSPSGSAFRLRANYAIATILTRVTEGDSIPSISFSTTTNHQLVLSKYQGETLMSDSFGNEISQQLSALQEIDQSIRSSEPLCSGSSLATISRSSATLQLLIYHVSPVVRLCLVHAC